MSATRVSARSAMVFMRSLLVGRPTLPARGRLLNTRKRFRVPVHGRRPVARPSDAGYAGSPSIGLPGDALWRRALWHLAQIGVRETGSPTIPDEPILREKARDAIRSGRLPSRRS